MSATRFAARDIEQVLPRQRLELTVDKDGIYDRDVTLGVAWALHADGYQPVVDRRAARYLGPRYLFTGRPMLDVTVLVRRRAVVVRLVQGGIAALP